METSAPERLEVPQPSIDQVRACDWDVAIVGAGPAGAAAALVLARLGRRVLLIDRDQFPRDKVCGDALIPDALQVLGRLGLLNDVRALGHGLSTLSLYSSSRERLDVSSTFITLRRRVLDAFLVSKAVEAGACFVEGHVEALDAAPDGSLQITARGVSGRVRASAGLTATGASVELLGRHGLVSRPEANGMALRCYVRSTEPIGELVVSYDRDIAPGYAWIFPMGEHSYNVGCGTTVPPGGRRMNLRRDFQSFIEGFPMARALMARASGMTRLEGARLRCGLTGTRPVGPGRALAIGEAIGATFPLTGEGIGKAIETGVLAGEAVDAALGNAGNPALDGYAARVERELRPRYFGYHRAERWLAWPRVGDFVFRRASRSPYLRHAIAGILEERVDPRVVFSLAGLVRSWVE